MFRFCCLLAILQPSITLVSADVFTVGPAGTHATLQSAVTAATGLGGDHEIRIQEGVFDNGETFVSVNDNLSLTISGGWDSAFSEVTSDPSLTSLSGGTTTEIMNVRAEGSGTFRLENLTMTEGFTEQSGAGVFLVTLGSAIVEILDCHFLDNEAGLDDGSTDSPFGAAIDASLRDESSLLIRACLFQGNTARGSSGASGSVTLSASNDSSVRVTESSFIGNEARSVQDSAVGGGLKVFTRHNTTVQIRTNLFQDNVIECRNGGAIGGGFSSGSQRGGNPRGHRKLLSQQHRDLRRLQDRRGTRHDYIRRRSRVVRG